MNYKYIIVVGDGMGDVKLKELGMTPLEAADKQYMNMLAGKSLTGLLRTIPEGMDAGSAVANLSIIGIDPKKYFNGRAPIEAANLDINIKENDVIYRSNFVTIKDNKMASFTANHIDDSIAHELVNYINDRTNGNFRMYYGTGYRNILIKENGPFKIHTVPPHDITNKEISRYLPSGDGNELIREIMNDIKKIISEFNNKIRKTEANSVWLWGQGKKSGIPPFSELYGINGGIISAVSLLKGIGKLLGLDVIEVPGATGFYDTDYSAKAEYALRFIENHDLVYIHVEAPDEAGHEGNIKEKIRAIENIDKYIIKKIIEEMSGKKYKLLILPDHYTPIREMKHTDDPIPFILYDSQNEKNTGFNEYSEKTASESGLFINEGYTFFKEYILES